MDKIQKMSLDFLQPKDAWDGLSLADKAKMMEVAVRNGITNLQEIRKKYNEFADGGSFNSLPDNWTMEDESAYRQWLSSLPDNLKSTDDSIYDMRRAFKAGMVPVLNEDGYYHLGSRDPQTGRILKAPIHPTYLQAITEDARMGYYPTINDKGVTYTNTWEGNQFKGGGYTSSDSIRSRIAKYEGKAMTGAIDPLSGKWDKNRSFEAEDASFYAALPESIREKVLANPDLADNLYSYSYNVGAGNFKKRVVPILERYYQGKATVGDIERSMWASGDAKLRGLRTRRTEEKAGVRAALDPTKPIIERPVSTTVFNPYALQQQNTVQLPQYIPSETEYIRTIEVSPEQQRAIQLQERFNQINRFNQLMKLAGIENTAIPAFMPETGVTMLDDIWNTGEYAKGGKIYIKPSHRGRLTELKKRTGKTEAELYRTGSPAVRKMITFARSARKWKHGLGGNLYSGEENHSSQMNISPNIFRRPNGEYFYQASPDSDEITVVPRIKVSDDPAYWTYADANGRLYTPKQTAAPTQGTVTKVEEGPIVRAANNYFRELQYNIDNGIPIGGKYTMPAIAASALLPLAGEAFAGTSIAGIPATTWGDAALTSGFGAHGLHHWANEGIDGLGDAAMTALEVAPLGRLAKPIAKETALAVENYRYPLGRPQVPENYSTIKPQVRTRVGDVEVDNPNLLFHLDRGNGAGAFSNQGAYVEDGMLLPGIAKKDEVPYSWWNLGRPFATSINGQPMTRLMTATKDAPGMLHVRSQNYPIGQWNGKRGLVLNSEYVNPEGVDISGSTYTLDPNYGWRRVFAEDTPAAEWPQSGNLHSINNFTLGSEAAEQVPDYRFIGFSLADAKKYKASDGYKALAGRAGRESEEMGTGFFPSETFTTVNEEIPRITFSSRAAGDKGGYDRANNIIDIDLEQSAGYEVPFHEGLHWQSVGIPSIEIGPNYQRYLDAVANDVPVGIRNTLLKAFRQTPEKERLAYRENAMAYLREKTDAALSEDYPIQGYMRNPEELQANGTETGKALGIKPFAPYPGYKEAKAVVQKAREYNENLRHVKADTPEEVENFWKIITGNYIPAVIGGVLVNEFMEE